MKDSYLINVLKALWDVIVDYFTLNIFSSLKWKKWIFNRKRILSTDLYCVQNVALQIIKGPLLGQRQFLAIESPFKLMKNAFYFMLKTLSILEIFTFLFWLSGYIKQDNKAVVGFKIYDVTDCTANNYNAHITQYLKK